MLNFRPPPPPNSKEAPGNETSKRNLRTVKDVDYKELSSQEDLSQEPNSSHSSRPILKASRGRVLPNLNESISEDDDVPDIEERPFKTTWEQTKENNELIR